MGQLIFQAECTYIVIGPQTNIFFQDTVTLADYIHFLCSITGKFLGTHPKSQPAFLILSGHCIPNVDFICQTVLKILRFIKTPYMQVEKWCKFVTNRQIKKRKHYVSLCMHEMFWFITNGFFLNKGTLVDYFFDKKGFHM